MNSNPKISIITVVRNGEKHIEQTIKSIISQTYENLEYIVIDGASTDGTVDIIKKYESNINYWISERDSGLYDALNKGVKCASGDWIIFIHADDYLLNETVISQAAVYLNDARTQIVYGKIIFIYPAGGEKTYGHDWENSKKTFRRVAMCIPHQATFHARTLFINEQFDTTFRIAGDYDFLLRHLRNHDATFIPVTIAKMRADGISYSASKIDLLKDTRRAQIKNKMYKSVPPLSWHLSAIKLLVTDLLIRLIGIEGKDKIKRILGK
jgi:glycosyltransferase involved in cell wall biosynthesis